MSNQPTLPWAEDTAVDEFKTAKDRYGIWPTTVWDVDYSDPKTLKLKELIGDLGSVRKGAASHMIRYKHSFEVAKDRRRQTRSGCFTKPTTDESIYRGKVTESIFSPAVASWILNCYATPGTVCYDPFGGGGTRAIMAAKHGMQYYGCELREDEVGAINERLGNCGVADKATLIVADAMSPPFPGDFADFLLTCPPYHDLERYQGGERDLSMCSDYNEFADKLGTVIAESARILKPGSYSVWVVGLHRDPKGNLLPLHHTVAALHTKAGFRYKEEVILAHRNNGAIQRVGNFEKGDKRLIRTHEYAQVFVRQ